MARKLPVFQYSKYIQVGIVVKDIDKATKRFSAFGLGPWQGINLPPRVGPPTFRGKPFEPDTKVLATRIGDIELEVFEPGKDPSPWKEFLDTKGEGIHHIAFATDDAFAEAEKFTSQGAELQCGGKWEGGGSVYVDLKVANIIMEFMRIDTPEIKGVKPIFPRVHHWAVAVKDINKTLKDLEAYNISQNHYSKAPAWLEKLLFEGKTFDTRSAYSGIGPFIHPMMYKIIEVGPDFSDPGLLPLDGEVLYRGKSFKGEYKICKIWLGDKILEIIQPGKGESPWREHIENHGEGLHHIGFEVEDLKGVTSTLAKQGATTILYGRLQNGLGGDYMDLGNGLIVEIFKGYY